MVSSERIQISLTGGAPWGFRLSGGGALPLTINKIRKKSRAHTQGLLEGDAVISINGIPVHDKSQDEALELVEKCGDNLALEIFRGDVDELNAAKPKKPIQIAGGNTGRLILTASVDDVSSSSVGPTVVADTSSDLILTTSVDDVSSDTYGTPDSGNSQGLILTATVDDVSGSTFDTSTGGAGSGFIVTASVDDMTSTTNQFTESSPAFSAQIGDFSTSAVDESLTASFNTAVLAEPFTDSQVSVSPARLSPQPPPKPVSPVVASKSPSLRIPPPVSPKPSNTTSSSSVATFDDGQTRREVAQEQRFTTSEDGRSTTVVQKESTTTTTTKRGPSFVKSQASAFNTVPPSTTTQQQITQRTSVPSTSSTLKSSSNFTNQNTPPSSLSTSFSANYLQQQQQPSISSSKSNNNISQNAPVPVFKPSRFVPGSSKKEIPGLFSPMSPKIDANVTAMYDGKENMAPAPPMFQVKNIVSDKSKTRGRDVWRPNVWLPGQQPETLKRQQSQQSIVATPTDDFSPYTGFPVPSVQAGISLADTQKDKYLETSRTSEFDGSYIDEEDHQDPHYVHHKHHKLHVFAPPVEIHGGDDSPYSPYDDDGDYEYDEYENGPLSPASILRKKNLYSDSAFYDTPGKCYPTITEQMKLCKKIAQSLTSAANKRARGAKMFMRRKRKSNKWVHEGQSEWSSSAGDVPNLRELDSELSPDEDGKALFYFKIPNLKNRIGSDNKQTKMALTQEQFEKLRLNSKKCDHKAVAPDACFDIAADLKAHKGRGGRMFEKRKQRSDKFVIANDNPQLQAPQKKLEHVLSQPVRQEKTPWEAAMEHGGNVDAAFSHIPEMERNQKLNQILKMSPPGKLQTMPLPPQVQAAPLPPVSRVSLRSDGSATLIKGKNFNRSAVGWQGGGEYPVVERIGHVSPTRQMTSSYQSSSSTTNYGNYNNKVKAWQAPGDSPYSSQPSTQNPWDQQQSRQQDDWQANQWAEPAYSTPSEIRQELFQPRPKSWQFDGYGTNNRDDYSYVPVGTRYDLGGDQPKAYMQPIIPGTDL